MKTSENLILISTHSLSITFLDMYLDFFAFFLKFHTKNMDLVWNLIKRFFLYGNFQKTRKNPVASRSLKRCKTVVWIWKHHLELISIMWSRSQTGVKYDSANIYKKYLSTLISNQFIMWSQTKFELNDNMFDIKIKNSFFLHRFGLSNNKFRQI